MKSKLNIWIINHYAGNLELGMEYRHFFLAKHIKNLNHKISLISSSFHHLYTTLPQIDGLITFQKFEGIPYGFIKTTTYKGNNVRRLINMIVFSLRLAKYYDIFEEAFGKPDIILGSSPHPFVVINLLHLKKIYKIPVIYEVRDPWPRVIIELGVLSPRNPLCLIFAYLEKKGFRKCDCVISLWYSAHNYMFKHGLDPKRYYFLPNGIEIDQNGNIYERDFSHPLVEKVQERKRLKKFIVGYGGSHGLANPLFTIVEACNLLRERKINDIEFFLVGDGPVKEELISRAKNLSLTNIHFHDYVKKEVIMAFYDQIDVTFMGLKDLPLFRYGPTPNKLMDYMVASKPIIWAIRSSFDPVKEAGAGISIPPDNAEKLVEAIIKLKNKSTNELASLGVKGHCYAKFKFSYKELAKQLITLCRNCIDEKGNNLTVGSAIALIIYTLF
ncbi:MAG: glycosyltransferase family 4 protein [Bacteroidetes bacterium]|nr:glycosyltransferase family 4 protein [Bacteroidota bacterium]